MRNPGSSMFCEWRARALTGAFRNERPIVAVKSGSSAFCAGIWLALALVLLPIPASTEPFVDLYAGAAVTPNSDATLMGERFAFLPEQSFPLVSAEAGLRGGYWLESIPWLGFAADVSYFRTDPLDLWVIPVSALVLLRYPLLADAEYPNGRLQPYAGAGPGAFISHLDFNRVVGETTADIGADVRAGLSWEFRPKLAVFVEYRFTHVKADFDALGLQIGVPLNTQHALAGIGIRF